VDALDLAQERIGVFQHHLLPEAVRLGPTARPSSPADRPRGLFRRYVSTAAGIRQRGRTAIRRSAAASRCGCATDILPARIPGATAPKATRRRPVDDLGLPIVNSLIMTDTDEVVPGRTHPLRDPRTHDRYAEPVLVPRGDAANEGLARQWFRRLCRRLGAHGEARCMGGCR